MTTGRKVRALTSGRMSSSAKSTAPSGVLKVAEMPADAPAASSVIRCQDGSRENCATAEPMAEPICTMGPSRPTVAPEPMESAEAMVFTTATRGRSFPSR